MSNDTAPDRAVFEVRGLSKNFGGIEALKDVDLQIHPGEVVALVGDNGAGKSTLVKMVSGLYTPSSGRILLDGEEVTIQSPTRARALGIETVYQDTGLVDVLDVGSNFFLGQELFHRNPVLRAIGHLDRKEMHRRAVASVEALGAKFTGSSRKPVGQLSGGQRASILIGRASHFGGKLLLMDEPTAALGVKQSAAVVQLVLGAARTGLPILIISHDLQEVFAVADRIVVLRLGRKIADLRKTETSKEEVVSYITGSALSTA